MNLLPTTTIMDKLGAFLRQYKNDILTVIVNITLIIVALPYSAINPSIILFVSTLVLIFSFFVIVYFRTRDKDFYFRSMDSSGFEKEWTGIGKFNYITSERCFEITNSDSGYIFPKTILWDDYIYTSEFKISTISIGYIVRATNLSNCIMLQFFEDRIKFHVRRTAQWIFINELIFDEKLSKDHWHTVRIYCEKRSIRINIKQKNQTMFDQHWIIPDTVNFIFNNGEITEDGKLKGISTVQQIDYDFGAIGVRNSGEERAFIKNITIEKL